MLIILVLTQLSAFCSKKGYLTIKAIDDNIAYLGIANKNVAKLLAAFELNNSSTVGQEE